MMVELELPRLLREAGIATEDQAGRLADLLAEVIDREWRDPLTGVAEVRRTIVT